MSRMIKEVGRWPGRGMGPGLLWLLGVIAVIGMFCGWICRSAKSTVKPEFLNRRSTVMSERTPP